jgi:CheY-like chemotaxis protein
MATTIHDTHIDPAPPALESTHAGYELPPPPGLRILCVDDNEDAADSLGTLLQRVGCEVAVAHSAHEALERLDEFRPRVHILDITMPGMDGCELAQRVRAGADGDDVLLIALTALGDYDSLERIADSGFDLYFTKPVPPAELSDALNRFADRGRPPHD